MPRGIKEVIAPEVIKEVIKEVKEEVKEIKRPTTLKEGFEAIGVEFRPECHRLIDLAKEMGVEYQDHFTLEDVLNQK
jgi:inhibitor of KinA sporulation pathway (predicted exonuclease)